jgi:CAAX prenyl protease-like protein
MDVYDRVMRRGLVPFEVAAVLVAAVVAPLLPVPVVLPLLAVAAFARWLAGRPLLAVRGPLWYAAVGAGAGLAGLALAVVAGAPAAEALTDRAVVWSAFPIVRGNPNALVGVAVVVIASAAASELVLRGWIVERVLELGPESDDPGQAVLAVLVGGLAEALLTAGSFDARIGGALFGIALGWMYVAGGRNLAAPLAARVAFSLGALALEAARLV